MLVTLRVPDPGRSGILNFTCTTVPVQSFQQIIIQLYPIKGVDRVAPAHRVLLVRVHRLPLRIVRLYLLGMLLLVILMLLVLMVGVLISLLWMLPMMMKLDLKLLIVIHKRAMCFLFLR
jgi:hypothetical protein